MPHIQREAGQDGRGASGRAAKTNDGARVIRAPRLAPSNKNPKPSGFGALSRRIQRRAPKAQRLTQANSTIAARHEPMTPDNPTLGLPRSPIFSHPDCNRRRRDRTGSCLTARGLVQLHITADQEFHPAPKIAESA